MVNSKNILTPTGRRGLEPRRLKRKVNSKIHHKNENEWLHLGFITSANLTR